MDDDDWDAYDWGEEGQDTQAEHVDDGEPLDFLASPCDEAGFTDDEEDHQAALNLLSASSQCVRILISN